MLRLMSHDYSEREYVGHLSRLLGLYEPFEAALAHAGAGFEAPLAPSRSSLLRRDLAQMGLTPAQIAALPRCGDLPSVSGAGLLGSLYVYEGTALGGQVIARRLRQSLGTAQSFAFYHENAVRTGQHWKAFCRFLETRETVSPAAICASAVAVFDAFGNWFESAPPGAVPDVNT